MFPRCFPRLSLSHRRTRPVIGETRPKLVCGLEAKFLVLGAPIRLLILRRALWKRIHCLSAGAGKPK
ncbi:hypothetical protein B0H19DRAFT_1102448 [Mycena capillaripes]|nr:hypothetical protein B0H19DRAFT_1102448 [Mycena capillaripes]